MEKKKRTEEERVMGAPIKVILGGEEYAIKPLVIKDSRPWRAKIIELLATLPKQLEATAGDAFEEGFKTVMISMPDKVLDLFFEYAKDLDRDDIETVAIDEELAEAFEQVIKVAFPLSQSLPKTMGHLSSQ